MSRFPFPRYPNGWFQVAYSEELPKGGVLPIHYFGKHMVLFRTEEGVATVLDAYCPHLGAHLGHGGKGVGDCIKCPFHAWKYDPRGAGVEGRYAKHIPPKAKVKKWHVKDVNGLLLVWYHAEGADPQWEIEPIAEYNNPEWTPYECRRWKIKTHNQEMAENAVD